MSKTEMITNGLNTFAANNNNKFTVKQVAEFFNVSEDTVRKVLRQTDGLQPQREGTLMVWSFVAAGRRVIKTSPEARQHKILRYFRSACYNAVKLDLSKEDMIGKLMGWMEEYEVREAGFALNLAA